MVGILVQVRISIFKYVQVHDLCRVYCIIQGVPKKRTRVGGGSIGGGSNLTRLYPTF